MKKIIINHLVDLGLCASMSEARKALQRRAVFLDGVPMYSEILIPSPGSILSLGVNKKATIPKDDLDVQEQRIEKLKKRVQHLEVQNDKLYKISGSTCWFCEDCGEPRSSAPCKTCEIKKLRVILSLIKKHFELTKRGDRSNLWCIEDEDVEAILELLDP